MTSAGTKRCVPSKNGNFLRISVWIAFSPQPVSRVSSCRIAFLSQLAKREASCLILLSRRFRRCPCAAPASGPACRSASTSIGNVSGSFWPSPSIVATISPRAAHAPERTERDWPADFSCLRWRSGNGRSTASRQARRRYRRSSRHRQRSPRSRVPSSLPDLVEQKRQVGRLIPAGNDNGDQCVRHVASGSVIGYGIRWMPCGAVPGIEGSVGAAPHYASRNDEASIPDVIRAGRKTGFHFC